MKRTFFRILAFFLPTRKLRNIVRRWGGQKIVKPNYFEQIIHIISASQDMSKLPMANGFLRYIQTANLKLLYAFDKFAKASDIKYFMIGGAISGKIRHNDCVPWDDDMDIGMLSEEYEKMLNNIQNIIPNKHFYILFTSNVCRIIHVGSNAFLDILRYDVYKTPYCYDPENQKYLTKTFEQFRIKKSDEKFMHFYLTADMDKKEIDSYYEKVKKDFNRTREIQKSVFSKNYGDYKTIFPMHTDCKIGEFYDYDTIFPIQRQKFNKYSFPFPNDIELYATKCWGNIWSFPTDMFRTHDFTKDMSPTKLLALREFNNLEDETVYKQFCKKDLS